MVIFLSTLYDCSSQKTAKAQEDSLIEIYFVPNNMTTYNDRKRTSYYEYKDHGTYITVKDKIFEKNLRKKLSDLDGRSRGKHGMRIKILLKNESSIDSVFMSYLPRAVVNYNNFSYPGSPELLNLVVLKIKEHYEKRDFICEGPRCKQEIDQDDIDFMNVILRNCEEYINK